MAKKKVDPEGVVQLRPPSRPMGRDRINAGLSEPLPVGEYPPRFRPPVGSPPPVRTEPPPLPGAGPPASLSLRPDTPATFGAEQPWSALRDSFRRTVGSLPSGRDIIEPPAPPVGPAPAAGPRGQAGLDALRDSIRGRPLTPVSAPSPAAPIDASWRVTQGPAPPNAAGLSEQLGRPAGRGFQSVPGVEFPLVPANDALGGGLDAARASYRATNPPPLVPEPPASFFHAGGASPADSFGPLGGDVGAAAPFEDSFAALRRSYQGRPAPVAPTAGVAPPNVAGLRESILPQPGTGFQVASPIPGERSLVPLPRGIPLGPAPAGPAAPIDVPSWPLSPPPNAGGVYEQLGPRPGPTGTGFGPADLPTPPGRQLVPANDALGGGLDAARAGYRAANVPPTPGAIPPTAAGEFGPIEGAIGPGSADADVAFRNLRDSVRKPSSVSTAGDRARAGLGPSEGEGALARARADYRGVQSKGSLGGELDAARASYRGGGLKSMATGLGGRFVAADLANELVNQVRGQLPRVPAFDTSVAREEAELAADGVRREPGLIPRLAAQGEALLRGRLHYPKESAEAYSTAIPAMIHQAANTRIPTVTGATLGLTAGSDRYKDTGFFVPGATPDESVPNTGAFANAFMQAIQGQPVALPSATQGARIMAGRDPRSAGPAPGSVLSAATGPAPAIASATSSAPAPAASPSPFVQPNLDAVPLNGDGSIPSITPPEMLAAFRKSSPNLFARAASIGQVGVPQELAGPGPGPTTGTSRVAAGPKPAQTAAPADAMRSQLEGLARSAYANLTPNQGQAFAPTSAWDHYQRMQANLQNYDLNRANIEHMQRQTAGMDVADAKTRAETTLLGEQVKQRDEQMKNLRDPYFMFQSTLDSTKSPEAAEAAYRKAIEAKQFGNAGAAPTSFDERVRSPLGAFLRPAYNPDKPEEGSARSPEDLWGLLKSMNNPALGNPASPESGLVRDLFARRFPEGLPLTTNSPDEATMLGSNLLAKSVYSLNPLLSLGQWRRNKELADDLRSWLERGGTRLQQQQP